MCEGASTTGNRHRINTPSGPRDLCRIIGGPLDGHCGYFNLAGKLEVNIPVKRKGRPDAIDRYVVDDSFQWQPGMDCGLRLRHVKREIDPKSFAKWIRQQQRHSRGQQRRKKRR